MDLMWLFTVPVLKVAIKVGIAISASFLVIQIYRWYSQAKSKNPFEKDDRKKRRPYIIDQKKRDAILKQGFSMQKVPEDLERADLSGAILDSAILMEVKMICANLERASLRNCRFDDSNGKGAIMEGD